MGIEPGTLRSCHGEQTISGHLAKSRYGGQDAAHVAAEHLRRPQQSVTVTPKQESGSSASLPSAGGLCSAA